jgi:hypothetical protein
VPPPRPGRRFVPLALTRPVLALGALAAALGSILALAASLGGLFSGSPPGEVTTFQLQPLQPLSYGEWRQHEHVSNAGVAAAQLETPGRLIAYDLDTAGFRSGSFLPVRIILHDVTHRRSTTIDGDPIEVNGHRDCGCFDWVAVPEGDVRYFVEVAVFAQSAAREQPLKSASTPIFSGAG